MSEVDSRNKGLEGTAGVDEAGRGPMIGPLVVCGVLLDDDGLPRLAKLNVRDSKVLAPKRRKKLAESIRKIAKKVEIRSVTASEIDRLRRTLLELLLAHAPDSPQSLELAAEYGADKDRFEKEASFCIHCGLCVHSGQGAGADLGERGYRPGPG